MLSYGSGDALESSIEAGQPVARLPGLGSSRALSHSAYAMVNLRSGSTGIPGAYRENKAGTSLLRRSAVLRMLGRSEGVALLCHSGL